MSDKALNEMIRENKRLLTEKTALLKRVAELEAAGPSAVSAEPVRDNDLTVAYMSGFADGQRSVATPPASEQARDAMRYQWLKHNPFTFDSGTYVSWNAETLDAAIDAAMKGEP